MAVVDAEEMEGGKLGGGEGGGGRTAADAIAGEGEEGRDDGDGIFHLFPAPNNGGGPPGEALVGPSQALVPHGEGGRGGEGVTRGGP